MSLGQSVAPVNTQLSTVGGGTVQGKYIKENVLALETLQGAAAGGQRLQEVKWFAQDHKHTAG